MIPWPVAHQNLGELHPLSFPRLFEIEWATFSTAKNNLLLVIGGVYDFRFDATEILF
jgi:hypothetical protein